MAGNRVEELESKVRELEATVSGLTDELVEAKERLRTLEEHTELGLDDVIAGSPGSSTAAEAGSPENAGEDGESSDPATQEDVDAAVESADPAGEAGDGGDDGSASVGAADTVEPTNETTFIDADEVDHDDEAAEVGPEGSADGTNSGDREGADEESDTDDIIVA